MNNRKHKAALYKRRKMWNAKYDAIWEQIGRRIGVGCAGHARILLGA